MGCNGSSESKKPDSNKVAPKKDPVSVNGDSPVKSVDQISSDFEIYKTKKNPEPKTIKGKYIFYLHFTRKMFLYCLKIFSLCRQQ
jgi:hypothetical protein